MLLVAIVIAVVVGCAGGLVGGSLLAQRTRDASLARELRRLTEEQRRMVFAGNAKAVYRLA